MSCFFPHLDISTDNIITQFSWNYWLLFFTCYYVPPKCKENSFNLFATEIETSKAVLYKSDFSFPGTSTHLMKWRELTFIYLNSIICFTGHIKCTNQFWKTYGWDTREDSLNIYLRFLVKNRYRLKSWRAFYVFLAQDLNLILILCKSEAWNICR